MFGEGGAGGRSFLDNIPRIICIVLRYHFYRLGEEVCLGVCMFVYD